MKELPIYYTKLYNAVIEALDALDHNSVELAKIILIKGQQAAEEAYLSMEDEPS